MNRIQSIFRKTHKLLFSTVALLLALCMLPTQTFAASYEFMEGSYYGGGDASSSWSGKKITGAKWPSNATQNDSRYGYRFYIVDAQGNIQSSVKDLVFFNPDDFTIKENLYTSRSINGKATATVNERLQANKLTSVESEATVDASGKISIYSAFSNYGKTVSGNNFKQWMEHVGADGVKNSIKVMVYLYGEDYVEDLRGNPDWYLIIEPTMLLNVWTNVEWAPYVKNTERKHYMLKTSSSHTYIDLCCNKTQWDYKDKAFDYLYNDKENDTYIYSNDVISEMGSPSFQNNGLRRAYLDALMNEVYCNDGYNEITFYEYVVEIMRRDEYDETIVNMFLSWIKQTTGKSYPYTVKEEINYAGVGNGISDAVEMFDYTSYCENARLEDGSLSYTAYLESKSPYGAGYHAVTFNMGMVYGTWYNHMDYLRNEVPNSEGRNVVNNGGMTPSYYSVLGNGFNISSSISSSLSELGISTPIKDVIASTSITPSTGNGIHVMNIGDAVGGGGDPIHTKDPVDPTPADPNDPITPETPQKTDTPEPFDNTGSSTIIKVYGEIYKDGSTVYHIDHKATYSETQTTDWIVIEDESKYKLQQWVVSGGTPDTDYTTTEWLNTDGTYSFDKSTLFTNNSAGYKLTYTAEDNFKIGEGNTIYLLYLKQMPYIETSDKPTPFTQDPTVPNPTKPENPSSDKNNQNNPDKKGSYNIVKIYAILDKYNGTPLKSETYTQSSTTPFIKIEQESNWTLANWKVTNTYNPSITAGDSKDI